MGLIVLALSVIGAGAGCQNKLHDENRALWQQNRELQARVATASNNEPKTDPAQLTALQSEIAQRDAKINELQNQLRQPAPGQADDPNLAGIETSYDKAASKMTVNVPGDVLFGPGDATIRDEARGTLDKVAASLKKDYAAKRVRIDGHTDKDPIRVSKWKSNEDLSMARAEAVKAYLVKKGVDASLITTRGLGSEKPKGKDKSANRRVEIVVAMK
jgi:outer membrane protein OmpA-like peptidoglycan-associated protein